MCCSGLLTATEFVYPVVDSRSKILFAHCFVAFPVFLVKLLQRATGNLQTRPPSFLIFCGFFLHLLWILFHLLHFFIGSIFFSLAQIRVLDQSFLGLHTRFMESPGNKVHRIIKLENRKLRRERIILDSIICRTCRQAGRQRRQRTSLKRVLRNHEDL